MLQQVVLFHLAVIYNPFTSMLLFAQVDKHSEHIQWCVDMTSARFLIPNQTKFRLPTQNNFNLHNEI